MTLFNKGKARKILTRTLLATTLGLSIIGCTTPNSVSVATTQKLLQLERNKADLDVKSFELSSKDTLVYGENQTISGEPLLLIHGFGGNMYNFTRVAGELDEYHVIIPDLLGFGESDKPMDEDYRAEAQAKRLHELMQAKGMASNLHIAGNSMGGSIAVAYASMYPNEVASVWLIDSAGFWTVGVPEAFEDATLEDNPLLISSYQDFDRLTNLAMHNPPYVPTSVKAVLAQERIENRALESKILEQITTDSVEERAKVIAEHNIPTLVTWGDKDQIIKPETASYIATIIPQAKVVMMEDVGHVPVLEQVERSAEDYKAFREGID